MQWHVLLIRQCTQTTVRTSRPFTAECLHSDVCMKIYGIKRSFEIIITKHQLWHQRPTDSTSDRTLLRTTNIITTLGTHSATHNTLNGSRHNDSILDLMPCSLE